MNEETRYDCFKRGWLLGASGRVEAAAIGTPEPLHVEDYQEGYRQGLEAFNNAMMAAFKRLGGG